MPSNNLLNKKCVPCEGGVPPIAKEDASAYLDLLSGWTLSSDGKKISKEFKFKDFIGAVNFINLVADIAEGEGHHPDIQIHYNKVLLELFTHAIGGLSENDFILAAKIDAHRVN
jgi:4a-hydroxytetrahydrobiopterin dehydratase